VEAAIDRMGGMLDQLYDLARSRIGDGIAIQSVPGDLGELIGTVVQEAELRGKGIPLELAVDGDARGTWDLTRVSRIAANLIANALQHGDKAAGIRVAVDGHDPNAVTFSVTNGGVIPPDLLPTIFEPFRRGNTSSHKGLGLGLYIVREIALVHGGTVDVTSTPATGTRFTVQLPRHVTA
jgi:signal transduction histidine kinase